MNTAKNVTLTVDDELWAALTVALERSIDDLELRAMVSERHDEHLGVQSAEDYRSDIYRLNQVLKVLGSRERRPAPWKEAVVWLDGIYTVRDGEPVRLVDQPDLQRLLDEVTDRRTDGPPTLSDVLAALAEATGESRQDVVRRTAAAGGDRVGAELAAVASRDHVGLDQAAGLDLGHPA